MIAVDTSALIAILLDEPTAAACREALASDAAPLISAVTLVEVRMVARKRDILDELEALLAEVPLAVIVVDEAAALRVAGAQVLWGKGNHPAQLNICDCFAYDVAKQFECPLLFVGNDFAQTDVINALA